MPDLDEVLKCSEHEAPLLICNIGVVKGKAGPSYEFTVVCPVDQKIETISVNFSPEEIEKLLLSLADKTFRCEKCFREVEILDVAMKKKTVSVFLSCPEHGHLITREITTKLYDKIRYAWDMKDVVKEEERIY